MGKKEAFLSLSISAVIVLIFFYKVIFGLVPFPGDLLIAEAKPWSTYSYGGYLPGTVPTKAQYPDVYRQLFPWRMLAIDQMKQGIAPLWNPYNFSGSPLAANFQSAPYYPFNILFWLLPAIDAWTALVMLQPLLAIWFTYLYVRSLGIRPIAGWFSAVSYGFSAYASTFIEYNTIGHVAIWLPLIFMTVEFLRVKITSFWLAVLLFSLSSAALAGHPQLFAYLLVATMIYIIFRIKNIFQSIAIILYALLSVGICALQYAGGIELINNAARVAHNPNDLITKLLIQPWQLFMLPFPNIFGNPATRTYWPGDTFASKVTSIGLIPLFFLPALWRIRKNIHAKFLIITGFFIFILITRNPISSVLANLNIPFWSTSNPTLMVFILSFVLSVSLGLGIDAWTREGHTYKKLTKRIISVIVFFIVVIGSIIIAQRIFPDPWPNHLHTALRSIIYGAVLTIALCISFIIAVVKPKFMQLALVGLLLIHMGDLWWMFARFNPFSQKSYIFPQAPVTEFLKNRSGEYRLWGYGTASIGPNIATALRLFSPDGYDPLYPRWYGEFISGSIDGTIDLQFTGASRSDAMVVPGYGEKDLSDNLDRLRILDVLGVQYILDRTENSSTIRTFPPDRFLPIYEQEDWKIFKNVYAVPRAFIANHIQTFNDNLDFSSQLFSKDFNPANSVLFNKADNFNDFQTPGGTAQILSYKPHEVTIISQSISDSALVLSDTYYPGWKAFIDGTETDIYKANWAFRAILVPQGFHEVVFRYEPQSFVIGVRITMASLITALVILIIVSKRKK